MCHQLSNIAHQDMTLTFDLHCAIHGLKYARLQFTCTMNSWIGIDLLPL